MRASNLSLVASLLLLACFVPSVVLGDTPANCTYNDMLGHWNVWVTPSAGRTINCSVETPSISVPGITFKYPNIAVDDEGNEGNWTLIYNQGVEVWVAGRVYFAFSAYNANGTESYCDRTQIGWAHDLVRNDDSDWNCIYAQRSTHTPHHPKQIIDLAAVEKEGVQTPKLVQTKLNPATTQLVVFDADDLTCTKSPVAFDFTPGACFRPPSPFSPGYESAMVTLDANTNEYKLAFWVNSPTCQGSADASQFGQGSQCISTGVAQSNTRINSPITTPCWLEEYYKSDCTGLTRNQYGIVSASCVKPLDSNIPPYEFWINLDQGASWIQSQFSMNDTDCSTELTHAEGSIGICTEGLIINCNAPPAKKLTQEEAENTYFRTNAEFLKKVNSAQSHFTVTEYPEFEQMTIADLQRRRGGSKSKVKLNDLMPKNSKPVKHSKTPAPLKALPLSWDWRNVSGVNYMSPVRDQGQCGSCYSFASGGMMEARIRIASNNEKTPVISTQDIVSCSQYSQGCEGGFPYLVAGKYGKDFGLLEENCYPYAGVDEACNPNPQPGCDPTRWYTSEYYYIGGYYGESTPERMMEEIIANGPIAVSFEVYDDFMHYSGGVYTHQFTKHLSDSFNPFELTNHVVVIIGWGQTDAGELYWTVKNSWSSSWGEQGYFRILRGSTEPGGECAIESITVSALPILH